MDHFDLDSLLALGSGETENTVPEFPPEAPETEDPNITARSMLALIYAEVMRRKFAGHHIDSMNSFYQSGIEQIITKLFSVESRFENKRTSDEEDNSISEIEYKVEFTSAKLDRPMMQDYDHGGATVPLYPNTARKNNLNYSASLSIGAKITAKAYLKSGGDPVVREASFDNHHIGSIPCQVGSVLCYTHGQDHETLKAMEEDPTDIFGLFIIGGIEYAVNNLENIGYNAFHVYRNMFNNEIARGTFLSKPGDAFEGSYQVVLRYLQDGGITVELTTGKFNTLLLPFYVVFRLFGMSSDREILDHIIYGVDNKDQVTQGLTDVLTRAFRAKYKDFDTVAHVIDQAELASFVSHKIMEIANPTVAARDENAQRYLNDQVLGMMDYYMFPHVGTGQENRTRKLRFLGHLINQLLLVYMGIVEPTDRDAYWVKRISSAGTSLAKAFKTHFNITVAGEIRKKLSGAFNSTPFSQVNLVDIVKGAVTGDDLEKLMARSVTAGNKKITAGTNEITNRVSSQMLYRKNDAFVKSVMCTIDTLNTTAAKQTDRADEMRRVQPSYPGRIDVSQSADTGERVGMSKQMAIMASICGANSSYLVKVELLRNPAIMRLDDVPPVDISRRRLAKVFVNGDWIGCCERAHEIVQYYRQARRHDQLHYLTSITWNLLTDMVQFWTDWGRVHRPLVIVYNNLQDYIAAQRAGKPIPFHQWTKLKSHHITGLQAGTLTMDQLRAERVIEYIAAEEEENAFLARSVVVFREHVNDPTHMFTHVDIEAAILGIVTLCSPMPDRASTTRITYWTNHRKQSAGWYALNYAHRIDKNTTLQHYCERSLVSTFGGRLTMPNGINAIVALCVYEGQNMEDSIIVNRSSVGRGMYDASYWGYELAKLESTDEQFGHIDIARTEGMRHGVHEFIGPDGFIREGTVAKRDYVLIAKTVRLNQPNAQYQYRDKSVLYRSDEPVYIERVHTARDQEKVKIVKVKYRAYRPLRPGDKLSSCTGNKGVVSMMYDASQMPYCEDGLIPDLIVNPHSIPSRMAVNQVTECVLAQLCAMMGYSVDATAFTELSIEAALDKLRALGIQDGGTRRMFNGRTGEWFNTRVFIGPTTYQRLQKFVIDTQYAMHDGANSAATRQPQEGRSHGGGLRIGEMEKDCKIAHGVMRATHEKMNHDSDGVNIYVCRGCGERAVVNEKKGIYTCKICGDAADISRVQSTFVANMFMDECSAMNVGMRLELDPYTFSTREQ